MALNFIHADFGFVRSELLRRRPNVPQKDALKRLSGHIKAFGLGQEEFKVPASGRRSTNLVSMLADLSEAITWHGLGGDAYTKSFPGSPDELKVKPDFGRAPELQPYRQLDPSRLVLHGHAQWDPSPYLPDSLWMAYHEPRVLEIAPTEDIDDVPDLDRESALDTLRLAKIWDVNGLPYLRSEPVKPRFRYQCMRIFNAYKDLNVDRQIADKRGRNLAEGRIFGDSAGLPVGPSLQVLEVDPKFETLRICASDRKDFYHQMKVSAARASTNVLWPPLRTKDLSGTSAFDDLKKLFEKKPKVAREAEAILSAYFCLRVFQFCGPRRPFGGRVCNRGPP